MEPAFSRKVPPILALFCAVTLCSGCDREAGSQRTTPTGSAAPTAPLRPEAVEPVPGNDPGPTTSAVAPPCLVKMPEERPREVFSVETCPPDVQGRPRMPEGTVTFVDAPKSPKIRVEHAVTDSHRAHGLMFRSALSDDEGMLFSWKKEDSRGFWMHNTCLALDMMFLDKNGVILGVLEQVPPMNDLTRSVPCPAAHVLEVRAGWTREHGVAPGQKIQIDSSAQPGK